MSCAYFEPDRREQSNDDLPVEKYTVLPDRTRPPGRPTPWQRTEPVRVGMRVTMIAHTSGARSGEAETSDRGSRAADGC